MQFSTFKESGPVVRTTTGPVETDAMESEFVDHQARHALSLAGALQGDFDRQQILLVDEDRKQLDLQPVKMLMHVA